MAVLDEWSLLPNEYAGEGFLMSPVSAAPVPIWYLETPRAPAHNAEALDLVGSQGGIRTPDQAVNSRLLYR